MLFMNQAKSKAIMLLANGNELAPTFMAEHMLPPDFEIRRHQSVMNELGMCKLVSVDIDTFEVRIAWVRIQEVTDDGVARSCQYQITYSLNPVSWESVICHGQSFKTMRSCSDKCGILTRIPVFKWKDGKVKIQDTSLNGVMTPAKYIASLAISQLPVTAVVLDLCPPLGEVGDLQPAGTLLRALPCSMWMWYPSPKIISLQAHLTEIARRKIQADALDYPTIQGWYRVTFGPSDEEADEGKITVIFDESGSGQTYDGPARIDDQREDLVVSQFLTRVGERAIRMAMPLVLDKTHRNAETGEVSEVVCLPCLDAHSGSGGGQEMSPFLIPSECRTGQSDHPRACGHIRTLARTVFQEGTEAYWLTGGRNGALRNVQKQQMPWFFRLAENCREGALPRVMLASIESWAVSCMEEMVLKRGPISSKQ